MKILDKVLAMLKKLVGIKAEVKNKVEEIKKEAGELKK